VLKGAGRNAGPFFVDVPLWATRGEGVCKPRIALLVEQRLQVDSAAGRSHIPARPNRQARRLLDFNDW